MVIIRDTEPAKAKIFTIGGKAENLFLLKNAGMSVPPFVVIPWEFLQDRISAGPEQDNPSQVRSAIEKIAVPAETIREIAGALGTHKFFAVRSSAVGEDGADYSFAGQLESRLFVGIGDLEAAIKSVWLSGFSERLIAYRKHHRIAANHGMGVIIQEMIDADAAGVAFGANPVTGAVNEKVINAVFGLGEGLVSGALDADHFLLKDNHIISGLAAKTQRIVYDHVRKSGVILKENPPEEHHIPSLTNAQIFHIGQVLDRLQQQFGSPQDIEFAFQNKAFFLLQTRPITTLKKSPSGEYILWDNSNIIESYPGVTTPLTFSFISKSYETAYKLFSAYLGVSAQTIQANERVFANTLGLIRGRVYYNLKTWYHMLAMLPGYSINARFMEKMMGVKEQFDIPESYRISKGKAWWRIIGMATRMFLRFRALPRKRRQFMLLVNQTISEYKSIPFGEKNTSELMQLYLDFERKLLLEWKAPLLNDFFAMIWFGLLQKQCEKYIDDAYPNVHNDLLCGSSDIISVEPVHRSIRLAGMIAENVSLKKLFISENEYHILEKLQLGKDAGQIQLWNEINRYISDFGERCVGELKLETISYSQDPAKLVRVIKSYVETGITVQQVSGEREHLIRANAEKHVSKKLKGQFFSEWKFKKILNQARDLVSARENLRYERTRAFGIVREIFSYLGKRFHDEGILGNERDIFYLTKEEIFGFIDGTSVTQDLKMLVSLRRQEFENYKKTPAPPERFATYGPPYHNNPLAGIETFEMTGNELKGIGCSPGRVSGRVRVVLDPQEVSSLNGDILVTSSTDPGWVMLFPGAAGIIVERGSLLSHSAIVSREMGKPCIVGVTGLLKTLKTGDEIEMDGSKGFIRIISA